MPKKNKDYDVDVPLRGYNAYVVDKLHLILGRQKPGIVEDIVSKWVMRNLPMLKDLGLDVQDAARQGYISKSLARNIGKRKKD